VVGTRATVDLGQIDPMKMFMDADAVFMSNGVMVVTLRHLGDEWDAEL